MKLLRRRNHYRCSVCICLVHTAAYWFFCHLNLYLLLAVCLFVWILKNGVVLKKCMNSLLRRFFLLPSKSWKGNFRLLVCLTLYIVDRDNRLFDAESTAPNPELALSSVFFYQGCIVTMFSAGIELDLFEPRTHEPDALNQLSRILFRLK